MKKKPCLAGLVLAAILALTFSAAPAEAAPHAISGFFRQIHHTRDMDRDSKGSYELFHQRFAGMGVDGEIRRDYPWLAKSIEKINQKEWQRAQQVRESMKKEAAGFRQEFPDRYRPLEHDFDVLMCRADTFAVSFIQKEYTGGYGAHGMYGWQGVTLSTATGAPIPLDSIIKDKKALTEAICNRLRQKYDQELYADAEKKVSNIVAKDQLNWTLDPRGITFYFNPYAIAPYSSGLLTATILFKEEPALFDPTYCQTAKAYAQPFTEDMDLVTSLRDDSQRDVLSVSASNGIVLVKLNGQESIIRTHLTNLKPVFIHMEDGRNYLYIDGTTQGSMRNTLVVQLGEKRAHQVAILPYSFRHTIAVSPAVQEYWNFLTNPNGFFFDQSTSFINTSKTDICSVNEKGTLAYG